MEQLKNDVLNGFQKVIRALDNERLSHDTNQDAIQKLKSLKNTVGMAFNALDRETNAARSQKERYSLKSDGLDKHWKDKCKALELENQKLKEEQLKHKGLAGRVYVAEKRVTDIFIIIRKHFGQTTENKVRSCLDLQ